MTDAKKLTVLILIATLGSVLLYQASAGDGTAECALVQQTMQWILGIGVMLLTMSVTIFVFEYLMDCNCSRQIITFTNNIYYSIFFILGLTVLILAFNMQGRAAGTPCSVNFTALYVVGSLMMIIPGIGFYLAFNDKNDNSG